MPRLQREIVINQPAEEVFDFVTDARNEPRYNQRILSAEKTTPGPIGHGTRFVLVSKAMGQRTEVEYEIIAYERPQRITSRTIRGLPLMDVESTETFEPVRGGTRLGWGGGGEGGGGRRRVVAPGVARLLRARPRTALAHNQR